MGLFTPKFKHARRLAVTCHRESKRCQNLSPGVFFGEESESEIKNADKLFPGAKKLGKTSPARLLVLEARVLLVLFLLLMSYSPLLRVPLRTGTNGYNSVRFASVWNNEVSGHIFCRGVVFLVPARGKPDRFFQALLVLSTPEQRVCAPVCWAFLSYTGGVVLVVVLLQLVL